MTSRLSTLLTAGATAATLLSVSAAWGVEEITLRAADHYPADSSSAAITIKYFMDEVEKASDGKIKFEYFPAQQLGKAADMLSLTADGVTDIGLVAPPYVSDKMPLSGVVELPGSFATSCEGALAYLNLVHDGPVAETDFAANGIRPLLVYVLPPYQILTKQELTGLDTLQGLKLRTGGGVQDASMLAIGAVPVRIPGPDIYESLARGTLDGLVFPLPSIFQYRLEDNVKYSTQGQNFGSFTVTYSIGETKWNSLPDDVKKILVDAGEKTTRYACETVQADIGPAIEKLEAAGVAMVSLPEKDTAMIREKLAPVAQDWASQLDARGLKGTVTLEAFRAALAK
jgi:TRAP-type C4-dicarboxylate transport system substrate-binding protein